MKMTGNTALLERLADRKRGEGQLRELCLKLNSKTTSVDNEGNSCQVNMLDCLDYGYGLHRVSFRLIALHIFKLTIK